VRAAPPEAQPDLYRQIQMTEANLVFPFTGLVAQNAWVAYRADALTHVNIDYTMSRHFYFSILSTG
jgi:hypothetical protein